LPDFAAFACEMERKRKPVGYPAGFPAFAIMME